MYNYGQTVTNHEYESALTLLEDIVGRRKTPFNNYFLIYRGESSATYKLIPTALREGSSNRLGRFTTEFSVPHPSDTSTYQIMTEYEVLKKFFTSSDRHGLHVPEVNHLRHKLEFASMSSYFNMLDELKHKSKLIWIPEELRELAGIAQHYGVPTSLLDWSYDVFVALYFAASGAIKNYESQKQDYLVLWILNYFNLKGEEHGEYPLKLVQPPYYSNPNLAAQSGVFSLWEVPINKKPDTMPNRLPLNELLTSTPRNFDSTLLYKITIPISECFVLMQYLDNLNYNAARLFPGYYGVAKRLEEESIFKKYL